MNRRDFLKNTAMGALGLVGCSTLNQRATGLPDVSKMNVLFVNIEDCTTKAIGCYGNPIPKTPNIDRLSSEGVLFKNAFCSSPACNPSRSSYNTGLRCTTVGVLGNEYRIEDVIPDNVETLPELMKSAGFWMGCSGKLLHQSHGVAPYMMAFDERTNMHDAPKEWETMTVKEAVEAARALKREKPKFTPERRAAYTKAADRYGAINYPEEQDHDYKIASSVVDMVEECADKNRRFFIVMGSGRPHTPLLCPQKYLDLYDPNEIPLPKGKEFDKNIPLIAVRSYHNGDIFVDRVATEQQTREAIAAYYGCVSYVDAQFGRVVDALKRTGQYDNTIIIYTADHGFQLGEHGLWSKFTLFDASTKVPLIVRIPGAAANGEKSDDLVELVDLLPTLCDLFHIDAPQSFEGLSFEPLLSNPDQPWKTAVFPVLSQWGKLGRAIRTREWQYNCWDPNDPSMDELYSLTNDPDQTTNLAHDPDYAGQRERLKEMLKEGWQGALPD